MLVMAQPQKQRTRMYFDTDDELKLALEMEALRLKLHEALDGYRQNESWIRPVQLPMPERQRLYQECMYILKQLTQQAEEGGDET